MSLPASYCSVSDVLALAPSIGSLSTVTSVHIGGEIGKVQASIDAKLARRYSVPFASAPPIIVAIATDLSAKSILEKRVYNTNRTADEKLVTGYEWAMDMLDALACGSATLVDSAGAIVSGRTDTAQVWSSTDYNPTMHEGAWADMVVDPDKLDDIEADRS